jgi:hypothetical protein
MALSCFFKYKKMNKIWVVFSIANEYDQPTNNLVAWWGEKPAIDKLALALDIDFDRTKGSPVLGKLLTGKEVRYSGCDYRLEEIEEGIVKQKEY